MKTYKEREELILKKLIVEKKEKRKRQRILIAASLALVLIFSGAYPLLLPLRLLNSSNRLDYRLNIELEDRQFNIMNAESLGVAKINGKLTLVKTVTPDTTPLRAMSSEPTEPEVEVVDLIKENEFELGIGDFNAEVYKFYVNGDFTFISYISSKIRETVSTFDAQYRAQPPYLVRVTKSNNSTTTSTYGSAKIYNLKRFLVGTEDYVYDRMYGVPYNFDVENYQNNNIFKSYVVYNPTGKIYSMQNFSSFNLVNDLIEVKTTHNNITKIQYFDYFINDNNLQIAELVSNPNIVVEYAMKASDGTIFVKTSNTNLLEENMVLYTHKNYYLAEDKTVYYIADTSNTWTIKKMEGTTEVDIDLNKTILFRQISHKHRATNVRGIYNGVILTSFADGLAVESNFNLYDLNTSTSIPVTFDGTIFNPAIDNKIIFIDNTLNKILIVDEDLYIADFNVKTGEITNKQLKLEDATVLFEEFVMENGKIITVPFQVLRLTTTSTIGYQIELTEDDIILHELKESILTRNILVLTPLN